MWLVGGSAGGSSSSAFLNDVWSASSLLIAMEISAIDIAWYSKVGVPYQPQWTPSMVAPTWTNLGGVVMGTGAKMYVTDVIRGLPPRYYRVVANP